MNTNLQSWAAEGKSILSATMRAGGRMLKWSFWVALVVAVVAFVGALILASVEPSIFHGGNISIDGFGITFNDDGFVMDGLGGGVVAFLALVFGLFITIWALAFAACVVLGSLGLVGLVLLCVAGFFLLPILLLVLPLVWLARRAARPRQSTSAGAAA